MSDSGALSDLPSDSSGAIRPLSLGARYASFGAMLLLTCGLAWLWAGAPALWKAAGLATVLLAVLYPSVFFDALPLALPWLLNQPTPDQPSLLLIEFGLLGVVIHHQALRATGLRPRRAGRIDGWLALFVFYSWFTVLGTFRFINTEWDAEGWRELYVNLRHFGTSPTFGLQAAIKLTLGAGLYQAMRDNPWGERRLRRFLLLALAGTAFAAVLGVLEYVHAISLAWWRPDNPDVIRFGFRRLQSLAGHPGWLAEYLGMLAPAGLALGLAAPRPWQRRIGWAMAAGLIPVQFLTESRGGWVALAAGYAAVLAGWSWARGGRQRWRKALLGLGGLLLLIALCAGGLALFSPVFRARAANLFLLRDRSAIWQSAWGIGEGYWLTGIGLGFYNWVHNLAYPPGDPFYELDKVTAHNLALHIWVERGVIGLVLFLGMIVGLYRSMIAALGRFSREGIAMGAGLPLDLTLAALGAITAFLVDGLVQYQFYIGAIGLLFWLFAGIAAWSEGAVACSPATARRLAPFRPFAWTLPCLLAAAFTINTELIQRWRVGFDGENLYVGGRVVELPVPGAGTRFVLPLGAMAPDLDSQPETLTIAFGGQTIRSVVFKTLRAERVEFDLPADRPRGQRLTIKASRIWRPLRDSGVRDPPFPEVGVLYGVLAPAPGGVGP